MKILVCAFEYPPDYTSGVGNVADNVVNQLQEIGVNCIVCSPISGEVQLCDKSLVKKMYNYRPLYHLYKILYFWHKASRYIKKNSGKYDVIWLHNPNPLSFRSTFQKTLITIHTTHYGYPSRSVYVSFMSRLEKGFYENVNCKFTAVSPQVCRELEELGVNKERITYIPNGVDTQRFKPTSDKKLLRKKFNIPEDDLILLSLGRLTDQKQPHVLIDVFSLIERRLSNVTLIIAGGGELLDKTKRLVQKKNMKNVKFLGHVDHDKDVPDLYACSDYYIMTSKYEGLPLTLLEAMSSGLPCIVSDIPNLRIVKDAKCGIVIDFSDEEKAAEEIIDYLERDNSEHSKNAREYAVKNLDWKIIAGRYLEELERLGR